MKKMYVALLALLGLVGCGSPEPHVFDVVGTLDVTQPMSRGVDGVTCFTGSGYTDIKTGTQVSVTDAAGDVVALGELGYGVAKDTYPQLPGTDVCRFDFRIEGIPGKDGDIFGVEVANRGSVNFKAAGKTTPVSLNLG